MGTVQLRDHGRGTEIRIGDAWVRVDTLIEAGANLSSSRLRSRRLARQLAVARRALRELDYLWRAQNALKEIAALSRAGKGKR